MFVLTTLVYPAVLAALCLGAGLLVDRLTGRWVPAPLLLVVGAAALIGLSQLTTYAAAIAPATPYLMLAAALAGLALSRERVGELARGLAGSPWPALAALLAYVVALAPVLASGRPTFSSYLALADSAVHMLGADYLLRHGQSFSHLDLRNSYGRFLDEYYNASYPSGADTLFGGSAFLLHLSLIWCFQPFNAFVLALSTGPAWLLARRMGLARWLAALAALTSVLAALDYAYELLGSVKEIMALPMILALGALVVEHRRWLRGPPARAGVFALVVAAGVSALSVAFGAWALAAALVLAGVAAVGLRTGELRARGLLASTAAGLVVLLVAAWPTWSQLSGSLRVARAIATTGNPGNLGVPLHTIQVLGVWLRGSYKLSPHGASLAATHVLAALVFAGVLLGALRLLRARAWALAGWIGLMLLAWLVVTRSVTTWAEAKTLVLTSPVLLLLAWGGAGALGAVRPRVAGAAAVALFSLAVAGGVLASDALQYHTTNLAPTARYDELASLNARFAGRGPTLFTDFDEWSLYVLHDLDVGGPDFIASPPALAGVSAGEGYPVDLDAAPPAALVAYPLIITRRNPELSRPPAAYRLLWRGAYYEAWGRVRGAPVAASHTLLAGTPAQQCARIAAVAASAGSGRGRLVAARAPQVVQVPLLGSPHPADWGHEQQGLVMQRSGALAARFSVPRAGRLNLWVQGELMPAVTLRLDGRELPGISDQLGGNSLVANSAPAIGLRLRSGEHRIVVSLAGETLAPGQEAAAFLAAIFLTPASSAEERALDEAPVGDWRSLCAVSHQWVELLRG